jgi:hypothetical protein
MQRVYGQVPCKHQPLGERGGGKEGRKREKAKSIITGPATHKCTKTVARAARLCLVLGTQKDTLEPEQKGDGEEI